MTPDNHNANPTLGLKMEPVKRKKMDAAAKRLKPKAAEM
jgi:predicted neutral ceramidase superfamily lipid hydrolase